MTREVTVMCPEEEVVVDEVEGRRAIQERALLDVVMTYRRSLRREDIPKWEIDRWRKSMMYKNPQRP